ncbi:Spo0B domain-containing protein [Tenuibacillus multivorans]|uniref:Sensor_kinase_SpoOB-type, alpha-helical domain n=1 Tax=Tenuibacillus multivorans TaxID=237069 RepID=A0A1G9ZKF1_9BACI|nr:Spo0B domain-containing protein [Tenuibacillus multivorans]GEL77462.1 hypothetical protein TMU01_16970 [Tenuibacillus multivorans]SDN21788.1 Sensor_kinase_SpoOB-type, alpha-helical domain [Tenuibacillus multivorans]
MKLDVHEVLQLIRLYRHDLMNDLQLVHGYASMKQYDVSMDKLNHLIAKLSEERTLQTIDAPQFVYWLIKFKLEHKEVTLEFELDEDKQSVEPYDQELVTDAEALINTLRHELGSLEGLHIRIEIKYDHQWHIKYRVIGHEELKKVKMDKQANLMVEHKENEVLFVFSYK